ncbi:MAG: hypothetical protein KDA85_15365 [Planctomycetaceae bacterium]|nr:hypothetical protein [Planctomycetaceae bacterium]
MEFKFSGIRHLTCGHQRRVFHGMLCAIWKASLIVCLLPVHSVTAQDATNVPAPPQQAPSIFRPMDQRPMQELTLLNPDGSPAANARVAFSVKGPITVNSSFASIPAFDDDSSPRFANSQGLVSIEKSSMGVVAATEFGFTFLPRETLSRSTPATLRPWARLKLDTKSFPEALRDQYRLKLFWSNNLAGAYVSDEMKQRLSKPIRNNMGAQLFELNWRIDRIVAIHYDLSVEDQELNVPPGEITIAIIRNPDAPFFDNSTQQSEPNEAENRPTSIYLGFQAVVSGEPAAVSLPEFGTLTGMLQGTLQGALPDWDQTSGNPFANLAIIATPSTAFAQRSISTPFSIDPYSHEGTKLRNSGAGIVNCHVTSDGKIDFPPMPVGEYYLEALTVDSKNSAGPRTAVRTLTRNSAPVVVQVRKDEISDIGNVTVAIPPAADPFAASSSPQTDPLSPAVPSPYAPGAFTPGPPPSTSADPYQPNPFAPQSPPRVLPPVPAGDDAIARQLISQWKQNAAPDEGDQELRALLKKHLESEFDSGVRSREEELKRLESMLEQSRQWLETRKSRREQIVDKRIDDLLKEQPAPIQQTLH